MIIKSFFFSLFDYLKICSNCDIIYNIYYTITYYVEYLEFHFVIILVYNHCTYNSTIQNQNVIGKFVFLNLI